MLVCILLLVVTCGSLGAEVASEGGVHVFYTGTIQATEGSCLVVMPDKSMVLLRRSRHRILENEERVRRDSFLTEGFSCILEQRKLAGLPAWRFFVSRDGDASLRVLRREVFAELSEVPQFQSAFGRMVSFHVQVKDPGFVLTDFDDIVKIPGVTVFPKLPATK